MNPTALKADENNPLLDKQITKADIAQAFDISLHQLDEYLGDMPWPELNYRIITGDERDAIMRGILQRMDEGQMRVAGNNDNEVWIKGWGEILSQIERDGFSPAALKPQYFDHHRIMRYKGDYIDGGDANFVYEYDRLLRRITLAKYLAGQTKVVELGCGTGTSQLMLTDILPDATLIASDWSPPSQGIIKAISQYKDHAIKPVCFNMLTLEGWQELEIDHHTAVLTVHALEQLGDGCTALMERLIEAKPALCVHLEPTEELYDSEHSLFDYLGQRFHSKRNYLSGWLTALQQLEKQGRAEIVDIKRLAFGDRYHEAYSIVAWKPL